MIENRDRRIEIDKLISSLRTETEYDGSTFNGLKQIAEHRGVWVIETNKVVIEFRQRWQDTEYVFIGVSPFRQFRKFFLAHEIGHALIDQSNTIPSFRELEADYFARSLVGSSFLVQEIITVGFRMLTNPHGCLKYFLDPDGYDQKLMEKALDKGQ